MSPIYTGDKFGFGASTSAGGGSGVDVYNNAGMVFTNAGAYGNAGPNATMMQNEYKDQKFWTENHYFAYTDPTTTYTDGGFIFVRAPQSGTYAFKIRGAFGGPSPDWTNTQNKGGSPWYLEGEVDLVGGRWIGVLVGQKGGEPRDNVNSGGGGGGGTYLFELDGSESETSISNSYIESASVTCLLVASGGNGANWQSWNSTDTPARDETGTGATDWILGAINAGNNWGDNIFGRGAFGGSFNYTPYSTVNAYGGGADKPWYKDYESTPGVEKRSGMPILNSSNKISKLTGLGGIHWNTSDYNQRYNEYNRDPNSSSHGAIGGYGGGGGSRYEGGGGGGYWGGAAWQEAQYNTSFSYGAQSYAHPTRVTVSVSSIYGDGTSGDGNELCGLDKFDRSRRALDNGHPHPESHGKLYLCPKAPKATAIGEAVFHADGHNIGENKAGAGKVTKYDWYVPEGVTSISVVTVGGGGSGMARHDGASGGGGSLAYKNNIAVTPGQRIGVQVGCGGFMRSQDISYRSPKGTDSKILVYPVSSGAPPSTGSVYLDGSSVVKANISGSQFSIPSSSTFGIEAWVKFNSISGYQNVFSTWNSPYQNTMLHVDGSGNLFFAGYGGSTYTSNNTRHVTAGNWHHVYVGSNGSSGEFYIDGFMVGGWTNSGAMDSGDTLYVGANMDGSGGSGGGNYRPTGYISNLRWVTGHKTYDATFTPPTAPLTATSQGVPADKCKLVAFNNDSDWQTTYQTSASFSMTSQYGSPTASSESPFSAGGTATVYALAGGGYGAYQSGQSCGPSHSADEDKALGGTFDTSSSDGGGNGGNGMVYTGCRQGGGGAGGYNGYGKNLSGFPSNHQYSGCSGDHGSDGGGGGGAGANNSSAEHSGGGGGVGIYGQGPNGSKADTNQNGNPDNNTDFAGKGGSTAHGTGLDAYTNRYSKDSNNPNYNNHGARGGMTGYNRWRGNYWSSTSSPNYKGQDGGFPGGGGGGGHGSDIWGMGGHGVVRILWGAGREFPSTNVDISTTYDSDADIFRIGTQPQY